MRVAVKDTHKWLSATIEGKKKSGRFFMVFVTCDEKPFSASGENANEMIVLSKTTDFSHHIKPLNALITEQKQNEKKEEIRSSLDYELSSLAPDNCDRNAIINAIIDDVCNDVDETADPEEWHSGDVCIALVRVLKERLCCYE